METMEKADILMLELPLLVKILGLQAALVLAEGGGPSSFLHVEDLLSYHKLEARL
jgi:hypothetical protein